MTSKKPSGQTGQDTGGSQASPSFDFSAMTDPTRWAEQFQKMQQIAPPPFAQMMNGEGWSSWMQSLPNLVQGFSVPGLSSAGLSAAQMALIPPQKLAALQQRYVKSLQDLWSMQGRKDGAELTDRRFSGEAWQASPMHQFMAQMYLLNSRYLLELADAVEADAKTRQSIRFAVEQYVDAMAPSNFFATNPEAQKTLLETQGESLKAGIMNMLGDLRKGKISQTDDSKFEVGRNVATSEGAVVFENEYFQLLQYKPLTAKVYERPFLMIPPCINKYYILDLQPENSVVRYLVEQGHSVFLVSWRNPDQSMASKTWDDYIENGAIKAIDTVRDLSGQDKINVLGFCVGGTITSIALAVMAARGERPVASLTLLTTLLDFSDTGILDVFVNEAHVKMREATIGGIGGTPCGLLRGAELATTFSFLRPNDLVWNYVVDNYLKGNTPPPFDLLYWNGDSTNLPGPMYVWYLRHMYLQNELKIPGKLVVCGKKVDLGKINVPTFIYGSREDHIVPWPAAYASAQLMKGDLEFVLGASGHIAGVINPPAKKKRSYWVNSDLPKDHDKWFADATEMPGSWWPHWAGWLARVGGKQKAAPKAYGSAKYKAIEAAPGRYVRQPA